MSRMIHETAIIDEPCHIGEGTKIWAYAHVMPDTFIGAGCMLGDGVFVGEGSIIGNGVRVQNGAQLHTVNISSGVFIGPNVIFTNARRPRAGKVSEREITYVDAGATIGAGAIILPGITIGHYAMVGAGAVVTKDVAAFSEVVGNPARVVGVVRMGGERYPAWKPEAGPCATDRGVRKDREHDECP